MLHTVNKSPLETGNLDSCMRLAKKGSAILLIEDAVYGAVKGTAVADRVASRTKDFSIYALGPDIAARGLAGAALIDGVTVVDYSGFVDLVAEHEATQAWL